LGDRKDIRPVKNHSSNPQKFWSGTGGGGGLEGETSDPGSPG